MQLFYLQSAVHYSYYGSLALHTSSTVYRQQVYHPMSLSWREGRYRYQHAESIDEKFPSPELWTTVIRVSLDEIYAVHDT